MVGSLEIRILEKTYSPNTRVDLGFVQQTEVGLQVLCSIVISISAYHMGDWGIISYREAKLTRFILIMKWFQIQNE